jgi:hypothetical protein
VRAALTAQGTDILGGTPKEFAEFIRADLEKWRSAFAGARR